MAEVKRFIMNGLESNCYVVSNGNSCYIVDIGGTDIESVKNYIEDSGKELRGLFLTHGHIDHIEGLNLICEAFKGVNVYIGKEDEKFLTDNNLNNLEEIRLKKWKETNDLQDKTEQSKKRKILFQVKKLIEKNELEERKNILNTL